MKKILLTLLLVSGLAQAKELSQSTVNEEITKDFISCGESKEMRGLVTNLMKSGKPTEKTDSYFSFSLQGSVLGLSTKEI